MLNTILLWLQYYGDIATLSLMVAIVGLGRNEYALQYITVACVAKKKVVYIATIMISSYVIVSFIAKGYTYSNKKLHGCTM